MEPGREDLQWRSLTWQTLPKLCACLRVDTRTAFCGKYNGVIRCTVIRLQAHCGFVLQNCSVWFLLETAVFSKAGMWNEDLSLYQWLPRSLYTHIPKNMSRVPGFSCALLHKEYCCLKRCVFINDLEDTRIFQAHQIQALVGLKATSLSGSETLQPWGAWQSLLKRFHGLLVRFTSLKILRDVFWGSAQFLSP